jgi:hypothetical protein
VFEIKVLRGPMKEEVTGVSRQELYNSYPSKDTTGVLKSR